MSRRLAAALTLVLAAACAGPGADIVTVVPCWPAVGPPGSPPGAPLPAAPQLPIEVSVVVTQQLPMYGR